MRAIEFLIESKTLFTDYKPKLIGLTSHNLDKLCENAGNDFAKFNINIIKNLKLPQFKGTSSNTLNLYAVYRKQKIYESTNKNLSDIEKKLFTVFNSRATLSIDSAKPGDFISVLMLNTLSIPNDKLIVNLQGFLSPKQLKSISTHNGIDYLYFIDGSKFPETDNDPIHLAQSWAMSKIFDSYESAEKAFLMYALEGKEISKDIQFNINVDTSNNDTIDEMALSKYTTFGDFTKPGPFRGADKRLVPHPKNQLKTQKFFEKTPYDFRLFFSNVPGFGKYSEHGAMHPGEIRNTFNKEQADQIINGHEDSITVVYVGNKGDAKVMLTPWLMAHRLGHAIQRATYKDGGAGAWNEAEKHFFGKVNELLEKYYAKTGKPYNMPAMKWTLNKAYNGLFNYIGTQRSSRTGQIRRPYEFFYELFAQYLGTGKITLNPFPIRVGYGRQVFGRYTEYLNIKPELRDTDDRIHASEILANDMEIKFNDVLASSVGKIYVM